MIKVGVIGTTFGREVAVSFNSFPNAIVSAIAGKDPQKTEKVAKELGIKKFYTDWKGLVDDSEIDLVCIVSPNKLHKEMFDYTVSKNKHILLEKPAGINTDEAKQMAEIIKGYEKYAFINHATRFHPVTKYMKSKVDDGSIGELTAIRVTAYQNWFSNPDTKHLWVHDKEQGGGFIGVVGVHMIDLGRYLNGNKPAVQGSIIKKVIADEKIVPAPTSESQFAGQYELEGGVSLQIFSTAYTQGYKTFEVQVFGTKGILLYDEENGLRESYSFSQPLTTVKIEDKLAHIKVGRSLTSKSLKYLAQNYIDLLSGAETDANKFCTLQTAYENMQYLSWE